MDFNSFLGLLFCAALFIYWAVQWRTGFFSTRYYLQIAAILGVTLLGAALTVGLWPSVLVIAIAVAILTAYHGALFGFKLLLDTDNKYRWIHKPNRALVRYDFPHDRITLTTADGVRLQALALHNPSATQAVIVCHGAGRSKNTMSIVQTCTILATRYAVFTFDFRGHMESGGLYRADNSTEHDLNAMMAHVQAAGFTEIAVFGWSVGGSTALLCAANGSPIKAIIAGSPPPVSLEEYKLLKLLRRIPLLRIPGSAAAAASRYMRVGPGQSFMNTLDYAERVPSIPILLVHNTYDTTLDVPAEAFRHLAEKLPESTEVMQLPGQGHLFDWPNTFFFWQKMLAWLEEHF